jgi:hypothetical protein
MSMQTLAHLPASVRPAITTLLAEIVAIISATEDPPLASQDVKDMLQVELDAVLDEATLAADAFESAARELEVVGSI